MKRIPTCNACGGQHYNFAHCPAAVEKTVRQPERVWRQELPEGIRESTGWGKNVDRPVIYSHPVRQRVGRLIGPDGNDYQPNFPDAA